jgi:undecaprenyl-diphosphatase
VTAFAFAKLASEVFEGDTMAFDRYIITALRDPVDPALPIGPRGFRSAMLDVTALGGMTGVTLLTTIVAGYLLIARKMATAMFLVVAISGGVIAGSLLKLGFQRPRPDIVAHLVDVDTTSFPSGHAMNSAVVYLTLGALLARTHQRYRERIYILGVTMILSLGIGFSRVYLGVHWPSDVMAGWMVGGAWATSCSLVARWLQHRGTIEANAPPPS